MPLLDKAGMLWQQKSDQAPVAVMRRGRLCGECKVWWDDMLGAKTLHRCFPVVSTSEELPSQLGVSADKRIPDSRL